MKKLESFAEPAYALLRVFSGAFLSFHGAQKIFGVLAEQRPPIGSQLWIGGVIELVGGLAIALGLKTRWAAFLCSGTMAVAYFQYHWRFAFDRKFFPAINDGELAAVYSLLFLYVACRGSGPWSLDKE